MSFSRTAVEQATTAAQEVTVLDDGEDHGGITAAMNLVAQCQQEGFEFVAGFQPRDGYILTRTRAISARINQNFDGFPSDELRRSYRSFLGKPLYVNHANEDPTRARGRVVAARYAENGDDKFVDVIQEVDARKYPRLAKELREGGIDAVSMGCSAERTICSFCGNTATGMFDMCEHVLYHKGQVLPRQAADGSVEDVLVYEECRDLGFFELSYVFDPADETALVSNVVVASRRPESKFGEGNRVYCDLPGCRRWTVYDSPAYDQQWVNGGGEMRTYDYCCDGHRSQYEQEHPNWAFESAIRNPHKLRAFGEVEAPPPVDTLRDEDDDSEDFHRYVEPPKELDDPDLTKAQELDRREEEPEGSVDDIPMEDNMPTPPSAASPAAPTRQPQRPVPARRRKQAVDVSSLSDEDLLGKIDLAKQMMNGNPNISDAAWAKAQEFFDEAKRRGLTASRKRAAGDSPWEDVPQAATPVPVADWSQYDNLPPEHWNHIDFGREECPGCKAEKNASRKRAGSEFETDSADSAASWAEQQGYNDPWDFADWVMAQGSTGGRSFEELFADYQNETREASRKKTASLVWAPTGDGYEAWSEDSRFSAVVRNETESGTIVSPDGAPGPETNWGRTGGGWAWEVWSEDTDQMIDSGVEGTTDAAKEAAEQVIGQQGVTARKDTNMGKPSLADRGRVASRGRVADQSRNDQGEKEETFITQTPPEEPVETADDGKITNTEENLVAQVRAGREAEARLRRLRARRRKQAEEKTPSVVNPEQTGTDEQLKGDFESADPNDGVQETQPKDASRRAAQRLARQRRTFRAWVQSKHRTRVTAAKNRGQLLRWAAEFAREHGLDVKAMYPVIRAEAELLRRAADEDEGASGASKADAESVKEFIDNPGDASEDKTDSDDKKESRRKARKTRTADEKLDVAAPGGRVDVEAPTSGDTDDEAQASQFDKGDFGDNAGDDLADPDLGTDQNWAPGEGKRNSSRRASGMQAVRLAEAMIAAGLEPADARWKLATSFESMSAAVVADRTALCERFADVLRQRTAERKVAGSRGPSVKSAIPQNLTARQHSAQQRVAAEVGNPDSDIFFN